MPKGIFKNMQWYQKLKYMATKPKLTLEWFITNQKIHKNKIKFLQKKNFITKFNFVKQQFQFSMFFLIFCFSCKYYTIVITHTSNFIIEFCWQTCWVIYHQIIVVVTTLMFLVVGFWVTKKKKCLSSKTENKNDWACL